MPPSRQRDGRGEAVIEEVAAGTLWGQFSRCQQAPPEVGDTRVTVADGEVAPRRYGQPSASSLGLKLVFQARLDAPVVPDRRAVFFQTEV